MRKVEVITAQINDYQWEHKQSSDGSKVRYGKYRLMEFADGERLDGVSCTENIHLRIKSARQVGAQTTLYVERTEGQGVPIIMAVEYDGKIYIDESFKPLLVIKPLGYIVVFLFCFIFIGFIMAILMMNLRARERLREEAYKEIVGVATEKQLKVVPV